MPNEPDPLRSLQSEELFHDREQERSRIEEITGAEEAAEDGQEDYYWDERKGMI